MFELKDIKVPKKYPFPQIGETWYIFKDVSHRNLCKLEMFALLESCLSFFKFSKNPTQPYSSAFISNFTRLLFLNPIVGSWHRRKPSTQSVHMRRSCQCSINYGAGCELAVRKDQQIRLKENWCTHTDTHTHTHIQTHTSEFTAH